MWRHDDGDVLPGLACVGGEVEAPAVDADVELGGGGAVDVEPAGEPAHRELGVAVWVQRVLGPVEQVWAVCQWLEGERHVVGAEVLDCDFLVLGTVVVCQLARRRRGQGEDGHC